MFLRWPIIGFGFKANLGWKKKRKNMKFVLIFFGFFEGVVVFLLTSCYTTTARRCRWPRTSVFMTIGFFCTLFTVRPSTLIACITPIRIRQMTNHVHNQTTCEYRKNKLPIRRQMCFVTLAILVNSFFKHCMSAMKTQSL